MAKVINIFFVSVFTSSMSIQISKASESTGKSETRKSCLFFTYIFQKSKKEFAENSGPVNLTTAPWLEVDN